MKIKDYNDYDKPSTCFRVNSNLLKHILILSNWCERNETPVLVKTSANEVKKRVNKYCSSHNNKVFDDVTELQTTSIERFMK